MTKAELYQKACMLPLLPGVYNKVSQMIAHAYAFDVIVCQSEFEALVLEASQIKAHTPKYNILLKDDKGYSYIRVTREDWPRLSFTLQKEEDGAEYIGPYTSSFAARQMAETAMDAFQLRDLQSGGQKRSAPDPLRQKGYPENPQRTDAGSLRPAGI